MVIKINLLKLMNWSLNLGSCMVNALRFAHFTNHPPLNHQQLTLVELNDDT